MRSFGSIHYGLAPLLLTALFNTSALGSTVFYSGDLRNNANITACGTGCTLTAGDSDATWAQWAGFAVNFNLASAASVDAITYGFGGGTSATGATVAAGGLEPYLSLFDSTGQFVASTYFGTTCPAGAHAVGGNCFDVKLSTAAIAAGSYTLVVTAYENMSSAEDLGSGLLSDGLTGLGNLGTGESLAYAFDLSSAALTSGPGSVPEPGSQTLFLSGVTLLGWRLAARRRPGKVSY